MDRSVLALEMDLPPSRRNVHPAGVLHAVAPWEGRGVRTPSCGLPTTSTRGAAGAPLALGLPRPRPCLHPVLVEGELALAVPPGGARSGRVEDGTRAEQEASAGTDQEAEGGGDADARQRTSEAVHAQQRDAGDVPPAGGGEAFHDDAGFRVADTSYVSIAFETDLPPSRAGAHPSGVLHAATQREGGRSNRRSSDHAFVWVANTQHLDSLVPRLRGRGYGSHTMVFVPYSP